MKFSIGILIFALRIARLTLGLVCPPCDIADCPFGMQEAFDEQGCSTCECLTCPICLCENGFSKYTDDGCPDCLSCLSQPKNTCKEIQCHPTLNTCVEVNVCNTSNVQANTSSVIIFNSNDSVECRTEAKCLISGLSELICNILCLPCYVSNNCTFPTDCKAICSSRIKLPCKDLQCKDNEHCEIVGLECPRQEVCEPKFICVPNSCFNPVYCGDDCSHGLRRSPNNCKTCNCYLPTCNEITCKDNYICTIRNDHCHEGFEECHQHAECIPASCDVVQCPDGFVCEMRNVDCTTFPCVDKLPKCVLETCENRDCGIGFQCINTTEDCSRSVCRKCVPFRSCSDMTCETGSICKLIKPDCPKCDCSGDMSLDCIPNAEGCNEDCDKPYAICAPDCKDVECPENCKYGCLNTLDGCPTNTCTPANDCEQIKCKPDEFCQVTTADCDSEGPCADMIATCVRYCPDLNCTNSQDFCPWGMMKDSNGCPTCDCNTPYSCDQVKCHLDDMCAPLDEEVVCRPCGIIGCENECSEGQQRTIDKFGCITCDCAPTNVCESMDCPQGQECILEQKTCDVKSSAGCQPWKGKCVCFQQYCHKFCEYGFKKNPLTGCETCECNDDLPTCEDITCPKGKTCVVMPACMGTGCPLPKPICWTCPSMNLCPACQPGHEREIDDSGCETCKCKPVCSDPFCDFECGLEGRKIDENGCPICECNPTKTCQGYQCPDDYECLEVIKKGKIVRFCKGSEKTDAIPTPI